MISEPRTGGGKPLYSSRLLLLAAVLVGVLILAFVQILTHRGSGSAAATSSATHTSTHPPGSARTASLAPSAASSPGGNNARCNVRSGSQEIPTSAPAGVTWQLYQTIALPFSVQAGPTVINGDVARCYAHSPTGALLAAVQIYVRIGVATDWLPVVNDQVMPGTGRDVFAAERPGEDVTAQPGQYGQVAGYQFVTYSSAVAVIQLVVQMPDGSLQMGTATVMWDGEDWRLELQPDGQASPNIQQLPSMTGFIVWEGV